MPKNKEKQRWVGPRNLLECPNCHNLDILHITIPDEGEKLVCKVCGEEGVIGKESKKIRRGFKI